MWSAFSALASVVECITHTRNRTYSMSCTTHTYSIHTRTLCGQSHLVGGTVGDTARDRKRMAREHTNRAQFHSEVCFFFIWTELSRYVSVHFFFYSYSATLSYGMYLSVWCGCRCYCRCLVVSLSLAYSMRAPFLQSVGSTKTHSLMRSRIYPRIPRRALLWRSFTAPTTQSALRAAAAVVILSSLH